MIKRVVTKVLQRYWRMTRALTMGAQGVVLDDQGRVLLIKHTYRPGWCFPGGGVEKNELVEVALQRELKEEANVELRGEPEFFGLFANFAVFPSDHIALYIVREWEQESIPKPNFEISACQWFDIAALPDDTVAPVRRRLDEIVLRERPSQTW